MPVELLIHATDHGKAIKGRIQDVRDDDELAVHPWGGREGPPNFVILRISDATKSQVDHYLESWSNRLDYEEMAHNADGRRYRISVPSNTTVLFGIDKGMRQDILTHLEDHYGAQLVSVDADRQSATLDIPNTDWQALRDEMKDFFEVVLSPSRFRIAADYVDTIAAEPDGKVEIIRDFAITKVIDRQS